jgi:hypothetical protein
MITKKALDKTLGLVSHPKSIPSFAETIFHLTNLALLANHFVHIP